MSQPILLGIEIGGTKLQLGLGYGNGQLLALERKQIDPREGAAGILRQIRDAYAALQDHAKVNRLGPVAGVGVGYGGPVDASTGCVIKSYQIEGWDNFPLASWLVRELGIPIAEIQNDADTAGLAEARYGAGKGLSPIFYVTIGSGIGGALIIDGQIYRGAGRGASEIGHLRVPVPGDQGQPHLRELEEIASGWGIGRGGQREALRQIEEGCRDWSVLKTAGDPDGITGLMIAQAAIRGDAISGRILDDAREAMAFALNQAIALVAPRRIILGGGVSLLGVSEWHGPIQELVERDVFRPFRGQFDIVPPNLGEEVVVHGAIGLAHDAVTHGGRPNKMSIFDSAPDCTQDTS